MHDLTLRQVSRILMCGVWKIIWLALLQEMVCMINDVSWLRFSQGEEKGWTFVTLKVQSSFGWEGEMALPSKEKCSFFTLGKKRTGVQKIPVTQRTERILFAYDNSSTMVTKIALWIWKPSWWTSKNGTWQFKDSVVHSKWPETNALPMFWDFFSLFSLANWLGIFWI